MKNNCSNLYLLSTISCQLAEYLTKEELAILASNLKALGEMLEVILSYQENQISVCSKIS